MSDTLYEYYDTGDVPGIAEEIQSPNVWPSQTFTIGTVGANVSHSITSVSVKIYRVGNPGTITAHIRATSGGVPTGGDLTTGTTNGNTLTDSDAGEWREIIITPYTLSTSTQYALIMSGGNTASHMGMWLADVTSPTYTGGNYNLSIDGGVTFDEPQDFDFMFKEYGLLGGESTPVKRRLNFLSSKSQRNMKLGGNKRDMRII